MKDSLNISFYFMINFFKSDEEGKENVSDAFSFEIQKISISFQIK